MMSRTSEDILSAVLGQPAPAPSASFDDSARTRTGGDATLDAPGSSGVSDAHAVTSAAGTRHSEKLTISLPAGCRRRYKIWCAEHDVTMSSVIHDYMESLVSGEGRA